MLVRCYKVPTLGGGGKKWNEGQRLLLTWWVISCIWEKASRSLLMRLPILEVACMTVEWSLPPVERGVGQDAHQGPFELADVRRDLRCDKREDLVVDLEVVHDRLLAQNSDPRLEVRRLDVGYQSPLEPAYQPVLEGLYVLGVAVGGDDDLLVLLVERVEGVEEGLLGLHLVLQELDVVHQEHVVLPVALLEPQGRVVPHGVD